MRALGTRWHYHLRDERRVTQNTWRLRPGERRWKDGAQPVPNRPLVFGIRQTTKQPRGRRIKSRPRAASFARRQVSSVRGYVAVAKRSTSLKSMTHPRNTTGLNRGWHGRRDKREGANQRAIRRAFAYADVLTTRELLSYAYPRRSRGSASTPPRPLMRMT
jgi:hypothetical protein